MNRLAITPLLLLLLLPRVGRSQDYSDAPTPPIAQDVFNTPGYAEIRKNYIAPLQVPKLRKYLKDAHQQSNPEAEIVKHVEKFVEKNSSVDQLLLLSRLHIKAGMYGAAISDLRRLQQSEIDSGFQYLELAFLSYSLGNYADAIINAQLSSLTSVSRSKQDVVILLSLSRLDFELERQAEVIDEILHGLADEAPTVMEKEFVKQKMKPAYLAELKRIVSENKSR